MIQICTASKIQGMCILKPPKGAILKHARLSGAGIKFEADIKIVTYTSYRFPIRTDFQLDRFPIIN